MFSTNINSTCCKYNKFYFCKKWTLHVLNKVITMKYHSHIVIFLNMFPFITPVVKKQLLFRMTIIVKYVELLTCRGQNVEKNITEIIGRTHQDMLTSAVSKVVAKECETICKRGSGALLQDRTYDGIFQFSWDKFHKEVVVKAPNTLKIISSAISSIPVVPSEKKFLNIMNTVASALHARSQEMSSLHYQIGFILTRGTYKQKVSQEL